MAKSRHKSSPLFFYKQKVGRPEALDELLQQIEYFYPRVHGYLSPRKFKGPPLLPFELAEIQQAVKAVPRDPREAPSRWAARIVAHMVSEQLGGSRGYRLWGPISGGRVRNMLTELKTRRKTGRFPTNSYELVMEWIRNGEVEVPIDVTV